MASVSELFGSLFQHTTGWFAPYRESDRDIQSLCADLLSAKGEVSGVGIARQILDRYRQFDEAEKLEFFNYLQNELGVDADALATSLTAYRESPDAATYKSLSEQAKSRRRSFFRRLNEAPDATFQLVCMRRDLLALAKSQPKLSVIDVDLRDLFINWFNRGFLVLRQITWSSPASILEKIISYEAVHEISSWDDLRRRVAPDDRCCFGFFHPAMPDEPLIFLEVALTDKTPHSVQEILAEDREMTPLDKVDHASFYSISNCQLGLAGISFGNSLIKTVVNELSQLYPQIEKFVTLSPLPGFRRWVESTRLKLPQNSTDLDQWIESNPDQLVNLASHYLLNAKGSNGMPVDAVSRFHLGNGARIHQLHNLADRSERGMRQSFGVMVNYQYKPSELIENHESFVSSGTIKADSRMSEYAKKADLYLERDS